MDGPTGAARNTYPVWHGVCFLLEAMHHWTEGWHMGGMWLWWLVAMAAIAAIVWLVVRSGQTHQLRRESPEDILKRRLASGEIDEQEYRQKLDDLRK